MVNLGFTNQPITARYYSVFVIFYTTAYADRLAIAFRFSANNKYKVTSEIIIFINQNKARLYSANNTHFGASLNGLYDTQSAKICLRGEGKL